MYTQDNAAPHGLHLCHNQPWICMQTIEHVPVCVCVCVHACVFLSQCACVYVYPRTRVCVRARVCVCPIWCSGMCRRFPIERFACSLPNDYGRTDAHVFLLFLILLALLSFSWVVTNSQRMPECVVWRVCVCVSKKNEKMEKNEKKGCTGHKKPLQSAVWWIPV